MKTIEQIRDAFHLIHRVATGQSDRGYMSIPADPERDADLIVAAAIDELEALRAERDALKAQVEAARRACEKRLRGSYATLSQATARQILDAMDEAAK